MFLLKFSEVADCFGFSLDTATRIIERDLPVIELRARGEEPNRRVSIEAIEVYLDEVTKADSALARKIQERVVALRNARIEAALKARAEEREAALPEIVRATRAAAKAKKAAARAAAETEGVQS